MYFVVAMSFLKIKISLIVISKKMTKGNKKGNKKCICIQSVKEAWKKK
jgi:hypothetical protein